jgi:GNAT superfamily N-acetyltransferase
MTFSDSQAYRIVDVNASNIDEYDVLCLKSKKKLEGYKRKVQWVKERFKEGLRLKLLLVNEGHRRGFTSRGFIEYIPGEFAWRGVDAKGYMVIHCIWVVGRNRKHGYGSKLLELCLDDAKGMNGVAVVTGRTWLPGKDLFIKHGFERADTAPPDFELFVKRFKKNAPLPKFNAISKERLRECGVGVAVFKSDQCPYTCGSVDSIAEASEKAGFPLRVVRIENCREAQSCVHPYGTFCVVVNGKALDYRPVGGKTVLEWLAEEEKV